MDSQQSNMIESAVKDLLVKKLTALDKAVYLSAWRNIYETANAVDRRGGDRRSTATKDASPTTCDRFTLMAAEALGLSERTIQNSLRVARLLPEEIRTVLADLPIADNMSELLRLADEPADRQVMIVELMSGSDPLVSTFAEAVAILDGWPEAPAPTVPPMPLKEWLSPTEIAELGLIGHLNSKHAVNSWIRTERPFQDEAFIRARRGKGHGFEYHLFALLPFITDDDMKLRASALLAERMEVKKRFDSFGAEGVGTEPVRSDSVKIDFSGVPTDALIEELMKRAGLLPIDRGRT